MCKGKVLVVEDNDLNRKLMRGIFKVGNYQIIEAADAETGIDLAREHQPFLILMDIQLPGMDGLTATKIIKADPELGGIPVVALTGFAMQGDEEKALEAGCEGYITKPVAVKNVLNTIDGFHQRSAHGKVRPIQ
ncbi:MAG: response regulator [Desulfatiglandales bacterium]